MDPAQYEAHLWEQMIRTMGLLLITYLPLQIGAILIVKHWLARLAASLPLLLMLPVMFTGFQTKTYEDGSLFGLGLMVISVPVMVYLALFLCAGLAIRLTRAKKPDGEPATGREERRLPIVLLTLAVLFGIAVCICFFITVPR